MDDECNNEMAQINELNSPDVKGVTNGNDAKGFEINEAIENSTIVQISENPYYEGLYAMDLEMPAVNDETEEADIIQKTENPYYGDVEIINADETNISKSIEAATILQNSENPYNAKLDDTDLEDNTVYVNI